MTIGDFALAAKAAEVNTAETCRAFARGSVREGARKLLASVADQKLKHAEALEEFARAGARAKMGMPLPGVPAPTSPSMASNGDPLASLKALIDIEEAMGALYAKASEGIADPDCSFFFKNLADEQKKFSTWIRDYYELESLR